MREEVESDTDRASLEEPINPGVSIVAVSCEGSGEEGGGSKRGIWWNVRDVMVVLQSKGFFAQQMVLQA